MTVEQHIKESLVVEANLKIKLDDREKEVERLSQLKSETDGKSKRSQNKWNEEKLDIEQRCRKEKEEY